MRLWPPHATSLFATTTTTQRPTNCTSCRGRRAPEVPLTTTQRQYTDLESEDVKRKVHTPSSGALFFGLPASSIRSPTRPLPWCVNTQSRSHLICCRSIILQSCLPPPFPPPFFYIALVFTFRFVNFFGCLVPFFPLYCFPIDIYFVNVTLTV